jgi:hypothetical protein
MSKKTDILMAVAKLTSPMAMMALSKLIEASQDAPFIRDGLRLLFVIKHDTIRKKMKVKNVIYWAIVQQLVEQELVFKHLLKLQGDKERLYIEFNFSRLDELARDYIDVEISTEDQ